MEPISRLVAHAVPIDRPNVDTDQILPARYLQKPRSAPFGDYLFRDLRFDAQGAEKPDFVLNHPVWRRAKIVVATGTKMSSANTPLRLRLLVSFAQSMTRSKIRSCMIKSAVTSPDFAKLVSN